MTLALLRIVPRTCGRAVTMIVACPPDPIDASLQVSGLRPGQAPLEGWTETIDAAVEKVSVTVGVLAVAGPALVTVIVYRSVDPNRARVWSTVLVIVSFASRGGAAWRRRRRGARCPGELHPRPYLALVNSAGARRGRVGQRARPADHRRADIDLEAPLLALGQRGDLPARAAVAERRAVDRDERHARAEQVADLDPGRRCGPERADGDRERERLARLDRVPARRLA